MWEIHSTRMGDFPSSSVGLPDLPWKNKKHHAQQHNCETSKDESKYQIFPMTYHANKWAQWYIFNNDS